ncbi:MAG TPA: ornithine cyclodeaminase family protein [Actinocatenispora sp.]
MTEILTDADVRARLTATGAVAAMRAAVLADDLAAPPRRYAPVGDGRMVFTVGGRPGRWYGYRSYDTLGLPDGDQAVVLHDGTTGRITAVAIGVLLGQLRTGALGGVAADATARADATTLGIIGTGAQAYAQAWAIGAVRDLTEVAVYGRDPARRSAFVDRLRTELDLPARAVEAPEQAVTGRDIVVLATNSGTPVIDPGWLSPGTAVTTLGPKQVGRAEFDRALAERAALLTTDSPEQLAAYDPPFVLTGTAVADRVEPLRAVVAGQTPRPSAHAIRLYLSVGLAGTDVALLAHLLGTA